MMTNQLFRINQPSVRIKLSPHAAKIISTEKFTNVPEKQYFCTGFLNHVIMKKLGYFLVRNTANILALYFLGWAIWAGLNWETISLVQKLVMGMFLLLVLHEYEEGYKERFINLMGGNLWGITYDDIKPHGIIHVPADMLIAIMFTLPLIFPDQMWLVFPGILLCLFEMFVHNWGIFMFRLKGVSPGWYTAMLQGAFAIYALVLINRHVEYDGIQWLWGALAFVGGFLVMEICTMKSTGKPLGEIKAGVQAFLKKRFGKG